jgi:CheY-like chemotaxis protein
MDKSLPAGARKVWSSTGTRMYRGWREGARKIRGSMAELPAVLVVDDDEAIRKLIVRVLRRERYDTAEAVNGGEALESLRTRPFATMVLDLMMPVMSGFEVVRYLETHDDAGAPCVIVVSAAAERDLHQIDAACVHAVLRKPFELADLVAAVRDCGRKHGTA